MNDRPGLPELTAFTAIVAHRSFRKAADEIGLSASTLSYMMRSLEQRMGVRLLNRTTRSVSPTEAGEALAARLRPTLADLDRALDAVRDVRGRPGGTLRINASQLAIRTLLSTVVPRFRTAHPEVQLDLVVEGRLVDIVAQGFDAGVRAGDAVPQDMVAVRFGGDVRFVAVASPAYLAARGVPSAPDDLANHECIRFRLPSGRIYRWEFERWGQELAVDVRGGLTLNQLDLMVEAAAGGLGIAFVPEHSAGSLLASGRLVVVLGDWCPSSPGLFLYYPGHRLVPPSLRAFIDVLTTVRTERGHSRLATSGP